MRPDPDLEDAIMSFVLGAIVSLFVFLPVLIVALAMAKSIYDNPVKFVLVGPIVVAAILIMFGGAEFGGILVASPIISSAVFYGLVRLDNPVAYLADT